MSQSRRMHEDHAAQARLAARLAGALTQRVEDLPHDLAERLRFAREQALSRARAQRAAAPARSTVVGLGGDGAAVLGGSAPWWQRAASVLPLLLLVAGLVFIDHWSTREQVLAAADIDTQLLSDNLPPTAYSDPGFAEFLRSSPP
jgi:hypothetical protein